MRKILVSGSIAYDHLFQFDGRLSDSIVVDQLDSFSASFDSRSHKIAYGGCAPNIAYSLKLLGLTPFIFGVVGNDFQNYEKWLHKNNISTDFIEVEPKKTTAAAYILTDNSENQLTMFSWGALSNLGSRYTLDGVDTKNIDYAIISPGHPERMRLLAESCRNYNIPYLFDPGQKIPVLTKDVLLEIINGATGLILNKYEGEMLAQKLGIELMDLSERVDFLVETMGENGVRAYYDSQYLQIPAMTDIDIRGVTGAGDAFRAGFLYGLTSGKSLKRACQMGSVVAVYSIESEGTQDHHFNFDDFYQRLVLAYGEEA